MNETPTSLRRACALAFGTAWVVLSLQILVCRIVSAKLLNNYAFLIISLTMLGFAFSGVVLSRWLSRWMAEFNQTITSWSALFVISTLGAAWLFYHAPVVVQIVPSRSGFAGNFLATLPFALMWAIPFACSGIILGLLLALPGLASRRIYGADLLGSAWGALSILPAISWAGVEWCLIAICLLQLGMALFLAAPRSRLSRALAVLAMLVAGGASLGFGPWFDMRQSEGTVLNLARTPGTGYVFEHAAWDPIARIEVTRIPPPDPARLGFPLLVGDNPAFLTKFKRIVTQNNFAFTYAVEYDGQRESLAGIDDTIYAAAYQASSVPNPKAAIIGVGGGFDVLTALYFKASEITAVEINSATVKILKETYRDYFGPWVKDPRVNLVTAEGRQYLARSDRRFDVIQLSGVDSYSGTPGAAHVFSESYLYTAEALDMYLQRLTDQGILNLMRLEHNPPREMLRALTTTVAALRRAGATRPADHLILLTAKKENFTAMLVKKTPFTAAEEARVTAWASTNHFFKLAAAPRFKPEAMNFYHGFLSEIDEAHEQAWMTLSPFNIEPATDNQPFFFHFSYWNHLWPRTPLLRTQVPVMEFSLVILAVVIGLAVLATVWLPLRLAGLPADPSFNRLRHGAFFAGTALGYLAIEVALLQKFGLFLGHPNYALSVVLATLLLATGCGALASARLVRSLRGFQSVSYCLSFLILIGQFFVLPLLPSWVGLSFATRCLLVAALVFPLGVLMGIFVATALERMKANGHAAFIPWVWGVNGIFSVLAPVLSVAVSITWGINALLLSAIPLYLVVGACLPAPVPSQSK